MSEAEKKKENRKRKLESNNENQREIDISNNKGKIAETTVKKIKTYLQRKKRELTLNVIKSATQTVVLERRAAKTAAERQREYRKRKKQKQMYEQNKELISTKPVAKTSAERNKAFRERQKQKKIDEQNKVNRKSVERTGEYLFDSVSSQSNTSMYWQRQIINVDVHAVQTSQDNGTEQQLHSIHVHNEQNINFDEIEEFTGQETLNAHRNLTQTSHGILHRNFNNINFDEIQAVPSQETLNGPTNSERTSDGIKKHINFNDINFDEIQAVQSQKIINVQIPQAQIENCTTNETVNTCISVAVDKFIGCDDDYEKETSARVQLHRKTTTDAGVHVESHDTNIIRVYIKSPTPVKARSKYTQCAMKQNISTEATPIDLRNAAFSVYKAKSYRHIQVKRRQFPLKPACTMTIHKSREGTYDDIVYTHKRRNLQSLVYVSLPRITIPRGLFIISDDEKKEFHHGRRENDSMEGIRTEFDRLSTVRLQTCDPITLDEVNSDEMAIFPFNCQSLNVHKRDLCGNFRNQSDVLLLSETQLDNEKHVEIDNLICVVKYKRPEVRAGSASIYKNKHKIQHVSTDHTEMYAINANFIANQKSSVGELCAAECKMHNGQTVIMVSVYISPGKSIQEIEDLIHFVLLPYTEGGAKLLKKNYHEIPMIIVGNFNVNFADEKSMPLIDFFRNTLNLEIANDMNIGTTRHGTTIDAVFSRFLNNLSTSIYVSHFSTHKPIVSVIKNNVSI